MANNFIQPPASSASSDATFYADFQQITNNLVTVIASNMAAVIAEQPLNILFVILWFFSREKPVVAPLQKITYFLSIPVTLLWSSGNIKCLECSRVYFFWAWHTDILGYVNVPKVHAHYITLVIKIFTIVKKSCF